MKEYMLRYHGPYHIRDMEKLVYDMHEVLKRINSEYTYRSKDAAEQDLICLQQILQTMHHVWSETYNISKDSRNE